MHLLWLSYQQDVSLILSTEDYRELMENVAAKSSAQFSIIPPVPSVSSPTSAQSGEIYAHKNFQGEIRKLNELKGFYRADYNDL